MLSRNKQSSSSRKMSDQKSTLTPSRNDHRQSHHTVDYPNPSLLYSAPTVDTLGDDSMSMRAYATPRPHSAMANHNNSNHYNNSQSHSNFKISVSENPTAAFKKGLASPNVTVRSRRKATTQRRPPSKHSIPKSSSKEREIQRKEDVMKVAIRNIPIAQRSAFALKPAPSLSELLSNPAVNRKKVSPSPQHLKIIHKLQSVTHIRQLAFSPSVGSSSDILYPGDASILFPKRRRRRSSQSSLPADGRYRTIDPVQATIQDLPTTPPLLSNKRHRLPMRADVGFPNTTTQEIQQKQKEISLETEWEEASPRLIVLVTSDDLGTATLDDTHGPGGLPPFAGPELIQAKRNNQLHFASRSTDKKQQIGTTPSQSKVPAAPATTTATTTTDSELLQQEQQQHYQNIRYSMLAPPLGATFSTTLGWRPRPFHDRPSTWTYSLVSPVQLEFAIGNIEPLVCCLSLYQLRNGSNNNNNNNNEYDDIVNGKASEDFYFPAGDWSGRLNVDALQGNKEFTEQWLQRKHKALFSHDPLVVSTEHLYVVLKVFKVTHWELATAYLAADHKNHSVNRDSFSPTHQQHQQQQAQRLASPSSHDKKSWRKRLRKQFQNKDKVNIPEANIQQTSYRASAAFDSFGTQFLSPLCFGVTSLYANNPSNNNSNNTSSWPKGRLQPDMTLYAYPSIPESQEEFVQRLVRTVTANNKDMTQPSTSPSMDDGSSMSSPSYRRKGISRFISPKKSSKPEASPDSATLGNKRFEETPTIPAKVSLFISNLGPDFLEAMLQTPPELADPYTLTPSNIRVLPKLLVDISGESAIILDSSNELGGSNDDTKRSNLIRLPPRPAGYSDVSDFREVLFLPPRPPKQYDVDVPPSYRSLFNTLYLYPRMLRQEGSSSSDAKNHTKKIATQVRYTVRIRLVESIAESKEGTSIVETNTSASKCFHNPAPWAGPSLLKAVYTKIPGDEALSHSKQQENYKEGIALQDEFKLRLPMVLDGNQYLQFTLFSVELSDDLEESVSMDVSTEDPCGLTITPIADTTIPLTTATREPLSGIKVATIIPNGNHRLKLGPFQLQLETRLVSSIHVSDPSVAAALREFPLGLDEEIGNDRLQELALVSHGSGSDRHIPAFSEHKLFSSVLASAAPTVLLCHLQPLLYLHIASLIRSDASTPSQQFITECMNSLLTIVGHVRRSLEVCRVDGATLLTAKLKAIIDEYDEDLFHPPKLQEDDEDDERSEALPVDHSRSNPSRDASGSGDEEDDDFDGGAVRRRKKDSLRHEIDTRISRTFSAMESAEVGFLRTAYGATKTDRMRLEAELDIDTGRSTRLVDDDETVITFATGYSGDARMAEAREAFGRTKTPKAADIESSTNSIEEGADTDAAATGGVHEFSYKAIAELGLAQRVRSAAKVMLAPCVPQNFFTSSPRNSSWHETIQSSQNDKGLLAINEHEGTLPVPEDSRIIASPGSDVEEENNAIGAFSFSGSPDLPFRSPWNCPVLNFSVGFNQKGRNSSFPVSRGEFAYETIMLLWIQAGLQFLGKDQQDGHVRATLNLPSLDDQSTEQAVHKFYANMDLVLPLCLKSLALRFGKEVSGKASDTAKAILDQEHVDVLESFFDMVSQLLMQDAMAGLESPDPDVVLESVLLKSEHVLDFLIGIYAIVHPAHAAVFTQKFFESLRFAESEGVEVQDGEVKFQWTPENLFRVKCSRQLRLRAVEKLSVLANFIALNYPNYFPEDKLPARVSKASWKSQFAESSDVKGLKVEDLLNDGEDLLPPSGWLARILTEESLSICSLSCEAVVAEAMAHMEVQASPSSPKSSSLKRRPTASLTRDDLLMFQSIAIHGITCVHELLLRRHAMDKRFQKESCRGRIAALFAVPIFGKSLSSVRWLARMESTHRVRSLWLLCFSYVLQEAPENLIREAVSSYCHSSDVQIHRFIRLLRLGSSTFQSFIDQPRYCMFPSEIDSAISPWLLQESFNTICATTIVVVEECASPMSASPKDQKRMIHGILDLLLHVLTTPQSSVTHLRAIGGAIQALERFGVAMFLEITGSSLQHWIRVVLGLMNSIALSVRSIAVDFVVSLLGNSFDLYGSIDELAIMFASVLPEVAAREIALCSVSGHIKSLQDAEKAIWPLRRSFADLEDANPLDDDRVDPQLSPVLGLFCRACQAILDGVLIEMRLQGSDCIIIGTRIETEPPDVYAFDADEESLFEAANFFAPETAPIQRVRWLMTLKSLHKAKGQWVEAAESLIACARAIADSLLHLKNVWRPSRFPLWSDTKRSLWLSTVGEDLGIPDRGNEQVMSFADNYLEPELLEENIDEKSRDSGKLAQPTISGMCSLMMRIAKEAVSMYLREEGMDGLAYTRLESLLMILMGVLDDHGANRRRSGIPRIHGSFHARTRHVAEEASLRQVIASISGDMTNLAERMLLLIDTNSSSATPKAKGNKNQNKNLDREQYFVRVLLSGQKPTRFLESTTLPTFLEWNTPSICRVPKGIVDKAISGAEKSSSERLEELMCSAFGKPLRNGLLRHAGKSAKIVFRLGNRTPTETDREDTIYVDIGLVQMNISSGSHLGNQDDFITNQVSKHFTYRKPPHPNEVMSSTFVEVTVANPFPCPLSRQRSLLTSEFATSK